MIWDFGKLTLLILYITKGVNFKYMIYIGGLGAGGEGDDRGWDGWMASRTRWTWVWVNSGRWWWIGRPGVLWFMGSQRVGNDWATELNWTELNWKWKSLSHVWLFVTPWTIQSLEFYRPEYWTTFYLCMFIILHITFFIIINVWI